MHLRHLPHRRDRHDRPHEARELSSTWTRLDSPLLKGPIRVVVVVVVISGGGVGSGGGGESGGGRFGIVFGNRNGNE